MAGPTVSNHISAYQTTDVSSVQDLPICDVVLSAKLGAFPIRPKRPRDRGDEPRECLQAIEFFGSVSLHPADGDVSGRFSSPHRASPHRGCRPVPEGLLPAVSSLGLFSRARGMLILAVTYALDESQADNEGPLCA